LTHSCRVCYCRCPQRGGAGSRLRAVSPLLPTWRTQVFVVPNHPIDLKEKKTLCEPNTARSFLLLSLPFSRFLFLSSFLVSIRALQLLLKRDGECTGGESWACEVVHYSCGRDGVFPPAMRVCLTNDEEGSGPNVWVMMTHSPPLEFHQKMMESDPQNFLSFSFYCS